MKKLRMAAIAAALMPLAACGDAGNTSDTGNSALEANAMIYQEPADNAANAEAEAMIANAGLPDNGSAEPANAN